METLSNNYESIFGLNLMNKMAEFRRRDKMLTLIDLKVIVSFFLVLSANLTNHLATADFEFKVQETKLPGPVFPMGGLPLFDEHTNGLLILRHRFVLKFQLRCILLGAPCDVIGRWLKPRIEKIMLENKCELCTPTQKQLVYKWVDIFIQQYPEFWRAALTKYAENVGIPIPPEEKRKMTQVLGTYP